MSNKFLVFLLTFLLNANLSYALTCKSGDSSCSVDGAAECEKLGYAKTDVTGCSHYIYCPFDTGYKTCLSTSSTADTCSGYALTTCPSNGICEACPASSAYQKLTGCNSGYTLNTAGDGCVETTCASGYAKSADNCGTTGTDGWSLGTKDANGCGKCIAKPCPGEASTEITSEKDCDNKYGSGGHDGYDNWGFSGDKRCGYCRGFQGCEDAGLVDYLNSGSDCDQVPVYGGNGIMLDCYDCSNSGGSGGSSSLDDCLEGCKDDCNQNINNCAGYSACVNNCYVTYG